MKNPKQNIRYIGFESTEDGARKFDFSLTAPGETVMPVSLIVPGVMFTGRNRISFQESTRLCYEKLRTLIEHQEITEPLQIRLTQNDVDQFRHTPREKSRSRATS